MRKFLALFKLGIKYIFRYKKRYGFLLAALVFGFTVVTFITSSKDGMYDSVYYSAQSHYAGDIIAIGYDSQTGIRHLEQNEIFAILDAANESKINPEYTVFRTLLGERGIVYFNGNAVNLKYVVGSDWEAEKYLFSKMNFVLPPESDIGDDGIILSEPVAKKLGALMGDSVILETETRWQQKNTGVFIVRGIVRDSSIFGYYKLYVSRVTLNRLLLFNDGDCSIAGFFINDISASEQKRVNLQNILAEKIQTGPLVYNREEMTKETTDQLWSGIRVFLYTMPVYLSEISDLLSAMNIVTYFIFGMMLIIILVSAAVTYRLILNDRAKEMGAMRAIGFYGRDLRFVLWIEVIALGIISLFAGFLLVRLLNFAVSFFSFSWFPSFEIFLKDGKLSILYLPKTVFLNVTLIFVVLIVAVFFPSFRASRKHLPSLLAGEPL